MPSIDDVVEINISASTRTASQKSFGTPLITRYHTLYDDLSREYSETQGLLDDGFDVDDPAYLMMNEIFSQDPHPEKVKVGRRATAFIQLADFTPSAPALGRKYTITADGSDLSYVAGGSDVLADVCTALATALNAVNGEDADAIIVSGASAAGPQTITVFDGVIGGGTISPAKSLELVLSNHANWDATNATVVGEDPAGNTISEVFAIPNNGNATVSGSKRFSKVTSVAIPTQSGTSGTFTLGVRKRFNADGTSGTKVRVTTTDAGVIIPYSGWVNTKGGSDTIAFFDATVDPGLTADLDAIYAADANWYGLLLDSQGKAEALAAAAWLQSKALVAVIQNADSALSDSGSTTDLAFVLKANGYTRTGSIYQPSVGLKWIAAGWMGGRFPDEPGSDDWDLKTIPGAEPYDLTSSKASALAAKHVTVYVTIADNGVTMGGDAASGLPLDITIFVDWLHARLQEAIFTLLINAKKYPYTDATVTIFTEEIKSVLGRGVRAGGLVDGTTYATGPKVATVSTTDRANRLLPNLKFGGQLAGAVRRVQLSGTVTV